MLSRCEREAKLQRRRGEEYGRLAGATQNRWRQRLGSLGRQALLAWPVTLRRQFQPMPLIAMDSLQMPLIAMDSLHWTIADRDKLKTSSSPQMEALHGDQVLFWERPVWQQAPQCTLLTVIINLL